MGLLIQGETEHCQGGDKLVVYAAQRVSVWAKHICPHSHTFTDTLCTSPLFTWAVLIILPFSNSCSSIYLWHNIALIQLKNTRNIHSYCQRAEDNWGISGERNRKHDVWCLRKKCYDSLHSARPAPGQQAINEWCRLTKNSNRQTVDKLELMASTESLGEQAMT